MQLDTDASSAYIYIRGRKPPCVWGKGVTRAQGQHVATLLVSESLGSQAGLHHALAHLARDVLCRNKGRICVGGGNEGIIIIQWVVSGEWGRWTLYL